MSSEFFLMIAVYDCLIVETNTIRFYDSYIWLSVVVRNTRKDNLAAMDAIIKHYSSSCHNSITFIENYHLTFFSYLLQQSYITNSYF
jgi:hypothetical protein